MKNSLTILHLEDAPLDAALIHEAVRRERLAAEFHVAGDSSSFRRLLESVDPDLVLSDFRVPGFSGQEALEMVRSTGRLIPFIFVSGSLGEEAAIESLRSGATDYVLKERLSRLVPAVLRAVDESRRRRDADAAVHALRESEERLKHALDATQDGLWDWTINTGEVYFSPQWARLLGYTPEEVPHRVEFFFNVLHPEDRDRVKRVLADHLSGRTPVKQDEVRLQMKSGDYRWFFDRGKVVTWDAKGVPLRMVGTITDVTERKEAEHTRARLEAQLHQAHKMESLGTLAGGIAHDFNNILGAIIGFSELVRGDLQKGSSPHADLGEVLKAANRAKQLVEQILTFSRQQPLAMRAILLPDIVQEALQFLRATIPSSIELRLNLAPGTPVILGDPVQIQQIVINLASNAAHAIPDTGGWIEISSGLLEVTEAMAAGNPELHAGPHAILTVADNGRGMDASVQSKIFEPFFTTKGPGHGTGLGLAVVHGISRKHQGAIRITSAPRQGARFEIIFPASPAAASPATPTSGEVVAGAGRRVMLVDDEPALVRVGKLMVDRLGFVVEVFTDSNLAWAAFAANPDSYDLVISDQTMPRLTGLELATRMLRLRPNLPIILATGYHTSASPERVREAGVAELLMKPFTFETLTNAIRTVLRPPAT